MRLNSRKNDDFKTNIEVQDFKVEMNSMLFYSVINGIYANKISSPMRELATNARDGHALAGKLDVPFDITLPSTFNPIFSVRDYGCSMSHEEIMGLYSTMFASSKRDSDEAVGMIGLGSKSPYSYVNQFTVTAWQDGVRRDYVASIGANDIPQIGLLNSTPSDEPTGIQVTIAVKLDDIATFKAAANEVFFGFDPKPNIANFEFPEVDIVYKGEGYNLYANNAKGWPFSQRAYARQGCVIYPIDPSALGPRFKDNPIWTMPIIVDFPIGSLSVNTSREALGYDAMTIKNIEDRMKVVLDDMTNIVQKEVDSAPRYIDACVLFEKNRQTNIIYKTLGGTLKYRGGTDLLRFNFSTKTRDPNSEDWFLRKYSASHNWVGKISQNISFAPVKVSTTLHADPHDMAKSVMIFDIEEEKLEQVPSRVRRVFSEAADKNVFWLKAKTRAIAETIWKALGQPDISELKTVTPLVVKRSTANATRDKDYRVFTVLGSSNLENELVDISQPVVIPYLFNEAQIVYYHDGHNAAYTRRYGMYDTTRKLLALIDDPDKIDVPFVFNSNFKERVKKMKNVQPIQFHEYFLALLKRNGIDINDIAKYCNDRDVTAQHTPSSYRSYDHSRMMTAAENLKRQKKWMPPEMEKFLELAKQTDTKKNTDHFKDDPYNKWFGLRHELRNFYRDVFTKNTGEVNKDFVNTLVNNDDTAVFHQLVTKYPLMPTAINDVQKLNHYMELLQK